MVVTVNVATKLQGVVGAGAGAVGRAGGGAGCATGDGAGCVEGAGRGRDGDVSAHCLRDLATSADAGGVSGDRSPNAL